MRDSLQKTVTTIESRDYKVTEKLVHEAIIEFLEERYSVIISNDTKVLVKEDGSAIVTIIDSINTTPTEEIE